MAAMHSSTSNLRRRMDDAFDVYCFPLQPPASPGGMSDLNRATLPQHDDVVAILHINASMPGKGAPLAILHTPRRSRGLKGRPIIDGFAQSS
jgi:hypothetical protein